MAEAVLFTLTNDILKLAGSNFFSKIQLARGARDDLKRLKYTVKTIQTMLLDAEKKQWDREQVKLWLVRLKDVLYDAQDLLEDVATENLRRKVTLGKAISFFFSNSNQLAQPYKVAKRIQEIRKKLDWIAKDKEFRLEEHRSEATVAIVRRRPTNSFPWEREIVGRQSDEREIIESLLVFSCEERVSVVPIVGMGGLGKTTLARLVYNNDKVRNYFQLRMWVCVSDVFDRDFLVKDILKSAREDIDKKRENELPELKSALEDIDKKRENELPELLHKVLDMKRYLLVLDDLWNEDHGKWSELHRLLMDGSSGSKILVTTRNQSVVKAIDTKSNIYYLKVLPDHESWDLFKKTAFRDEEESLNQKLEQIGQDIVKKCGGVPLAIKTIGNLLYAKKENEWGHFQTKEFSMLNPEIMEVLKISYDHLEPGLKHCFAYCALFPKDFVFNKQDMIQLWMAQGFIESFGSLGENEELEEIGNGYVSHLLFRSFLEVEEVNRYTGEVEMFKMHDLMHDLALKVTGNECKMVNLNKSSIDEDIRHALFDFKLSLQEVTPLLEATNLRTFLPLRGIKRLSPNRLSPNEVGSTPTWRFHPSFFFTKKKDRLSPNECHWIFSKLRHCRTLQLNHLDCDPLSLGSQLKHLRFLEVIGNSSIKSLPDSITNLLNLQTLKLSGCWNLKTLSKDFWKLVNLRYLSIVGCSSLSHLPSLSKLSSLRTLSLMSLKSLKFVPLLLQSSTTRPFFPSLESLTLCDCHKFKGWWRRREVMMEFLKHQSDNSQSSFPKLRSMRIQRCSALLFVPLFPQVEYLKIDDSIYLRDWFSELAVGSAFPSFKLKHLHLHGADFRSSILENLLKFASNFESMELHDSRLEDPFPDKQDPLNFNYHESIYDGMELQFCNLRSLSAGMQHLSSLRELGIWGSVEFSLENLSSRDEQVIHQEEDEQDEQGTQWQFLTKLCILKISYHMDLVTLPKLFQHATDLQSLQIFMCEKLTSLPKWIENFSKLEKLVISNCSKLERLEFDMRNLTLLKELRIINCPSLDEVPNRCARSGQCSGGDESERLAQYTEYSANIYQEEEGVPLLQFAPASLVKALFGSAVRMLIWALKGLGQMLWCLVNFFENCGEMQFHLG